VIVGSPSRETCARAAAQLATPESAHVVNRRCIECHSEQPTNRAFPIAPQGSWLDTALQMKQYSRGSIARVAVEHTMPLANMSGMTTKSAGFLGRWVEHGCHSPIVADGTWRQLAVIALNAPGISALVLALARHGPLCACTGGTGTGAPGSRLRKRALVEVGPASGRFTSHRGHRPGR